MWKCDCSPLEMCGDVWGHVEIEVDVRKCEDMKRFAGTFGDMQICGDLCTHEKTYGDVWRYAET